MSLKVTSQTRDFSPDMVRKRYVKAPSTLGSWDWCEVGDDRRFDIRRGTLTPDELPEDVRAAAWERRENGVWPYYVEWPL